MQFMLDTNVLSELMKPAPDERVLRWFDLHAKAEFSTTAINLSIDCWKSSGLITPRLFKMPNFEAMPSLHRASAISF